MASGPSSSRTWLPYTIAIIAGIAVMGAAYVVVKTDTFGADRSHCVQLEVVSSTEKDVLVRELAQRYGAADREFDDGLCASITVDGVTSGKAMESLDKGWAAAQPKIPQPQVWLPTSSLWTGQLQLRDKAAGRPAQTPGKFESIANSPLVIAMKQPKGELVQGKGALGWNDILGLSGDQGWAAFGKPEWGRFTFGKDNPTLSTSGLAATIATYYAAMGTSSDLMTVDLAKPSVTKFVREIEANVSHYSDDVVDLLRNLAANDLTTVETDAPQTDVSAIVMQEELVYLYNEGKLSPKYGEKPKVPLVALYPKEGTFNLDHPYVVLPTADARQQAAAKDFLAFLQEPEQQRSFADIGFRDHERTASKSLFESLRGRDNAELSYFDAPDPTVVQAILGGWSTLRKKANILMAVDTSGSMTSMIGNQTRLQVAVGAATNGVNLLNDEDRVGLWSFSSVTPRRGKTPYSNEITLGRFDSRAFGGKLKTLKPEGGTALYATVRAAHQYVLDHYDRNRINAVVVLTDGKNEYPPDNDLKKLLKDITLDPDRPVKIFCIAFDDQSDLETLTRIAKATGGKAFDAQDPTKINEAFVKLVSAF
ncbi:Ca-activated chloride channel family protein [Allocatelliglobosispora scoriae]|uniref:Ca-activated chloride channel family protein n=1 Tax=Allocatelliglobosispora scoriae TaxID=643052 RepID=A0A841BXQ0_9ACTN|nr:substrate-binding and VWA domain-containing protein [Allocatelliglobosispora scoriae]MBB5873927.1 Ca-activated chloride channel family protein [Allocatelliglobosispora scoriae]